MPRKRRMQVLPIIEDDDKEEESIPQEELTPTEKRTWIQLGHQQFFIEDVQSVYIQANHLIINFDYTHKQIIIFFGRNENSYKNAKVVFDALGEMFNAYKIALPEDAIPDPDILKTVYGENIDKAIQDRVHYEKDKFKKRHQRKLQKALYEIEELKKKIRKD